MHGLPEIGVSPCAAVVTCRLRASSIRHVRKGARRSAPNILGRRLRRADGVADFANFLTEEQRSSDHNHGDECDGQGVRHHAGTRHILYEPGLVGRPKTALSLSHRSRPSS